MWSWYFILVSIAALGSMTLLFFDLGPFKKLHRIILLILILVAIVENLGFYLATNGKPNLVYYNAIFVYTLPILYLYFFKEIFQQGSVKNAFIMLGVLFLLFGTVKSLFFTSILEFHHNSYILGSMIILGCCFYFFYGLISKNMFIEINLLRFPVFWVVTFLLFFYSSSILNFASIRYVTTTNFELMRMMQNIINALGAFMYLVFAISFYLPLIKNKKTKISSNLS
ncbi:hypothetical protein B879_01874 [Cecembia lonarensis LW9]|uniref:Uncharacterized protein n=1 Tax=Cecembia lonarensis (strain CCUG 58316 / KCTC 22772 / LW9) TaxID=1225176 RepID=K1LB29_CECL9|nr:hypothetical protein B879_01874 [Cecembia lonarensis LW9]